MDSCEMVALVQIIILIKSILILVIIIIERAMGILR